MYSLNAEVEDLVSVIVITYNSELYVNETLDSIYRQSYKNIELIISDDCSQDNTLNVCQSWIKEHQHRFINIRILGIEKNTGIPANINRGIRSAIGEWIKIIAGDDVLCNNCIMDNMNYVNLHPEISFLFSNAIKINEQGHIIKENIQVSIDIWNKSVEEQYCYLISRGSFASAPTSFIKKDALIKIGLFDETIRLCEDYPMWINATKNNFKLFLLTKETVRYRVYSKSVCGSQRNTNFYKSLWLNYKKNVFWPLFKLNPLQAYDCGLSLFLHSRGWYEGSFPELLMITSPYSLLRFLKKNRLLYR